MFFFLAQINLSYCLIMSPKLCDNMALSKSSKTKVFVLCAFMFLKLQVPSSLKANRFFLSKLLISIVLPKHDFIVHQAIYSTSRRQLFGNVYQRTYIKLILGEHKVARNHCLVSISRIILCNPHEIIFTQAQNGKIRTTVVTCSVSVRDCPPDGRVVNLQE